MGPVGPMGPQGPPGIGAIEVIVERRNADGLGNRTLDAQCPSGKAALSAGYVTRNPERVGDERSGLTALEFYPIGANSVAATRVNPATGWRLVSLNATLLEVYVICYQP